MNHDFTRAAVLSLLLGATLAPVSAAAPAGQQIAFEDVLARRRAGEPAARIPPRR